MDHLSKPRPRPAMAALVFFILALPAGAQLTTASLLADLNQNPISGDPGELTELGGKLYFYAQDSLGQEPWSFDPGTGDSQRLADLEPGGFSSFPEQFRTTGTLLFFEARGEIYKHDPAVPETVHIPVNPSDGASADCLVVIGGKLYFQAEGDASGIELWEHDPATGVTQRLTDINPGSGDSRPEQMVGLGTDIYFVADDPDNGDEIHRYDTLGIGVERVTLLNGTESAFIQHLTAAGGKLFFSYEDDAVGEELFSFNPSDNMVTMAEDYAPGTEGSFPAELTLLGGDLYLRVSRVVSGRSKSELARVDPATLQFEELTDLNADLGAATFGYGPFELTPLAGKLYFNASNQANGGGPELFVFDPSDDSIAVAAEIAAGTAGGNPVGLRAIDGMLYFAADDGTTGLEAYELDPADESFVSLADLNPGAAGSFPGEFVNAGALIYFAASGPTLGQELYSFDPVGRQVVLADDVGLGTEGSAFDFGFSPGFIHFDGAIYFAADDGSASGAHLFKIDPETLGVTPVGDANLGPLPGAIQSFTVVGDELLFSASNTQTGTDLWKLEAGETQPVAVDIIPGPNSAQPIGVFNLGRAFFPVAGGKAYFAASSDASGREVFQYDPATGTATVAAEIRPAASSSNPFMKGAFGGKVFFSADDGTAPGTRFLFVLEPSDNSHHAIIDAETSEKMIGDLGSISAQLAEVNGIVYFNSYRPTIGEELFRYDIGQDAGSLAAELATGDLFPGTPLSGSPRRIRALGGALLFTGNFATGAINDEIGQYDPATGMASPLSSGLSPRPLAAVVGGEYVFTATDEAQQFGLELYRARPGQPPQRIADIFAGPEDSIYFETALEAADDFVFFAAQDSGATNAEPYVYGPEIGFAFLLADVFPGSGDSAPRDFILSGQTLIFYASDGTTGLEPRRLDFPFQTTGVAWPSGELE